MSKIIIFSLLISVTNIAQAVTFFGAPTITKSVAEGTTYLFTETLSGKLPTGYKVKIDLHNGKGLVAMKCSATICTLSSNTLPKNVDSATYEVGVYDSKGVLQDVTVYGSYTKVSYGLARSYTKISNLGADLPDSAVLGSNPNDWACTKDNQTGLIWEVKTTDGGLRDMNKTYTNYFATIGYGSSNGYGQKNTDVFVGLVNKQSLCGKSNWRLPNSDELRHLVFCSNGHYSEDGLCADFDVVSRPAINTTYFPNTAGGYWSSSQYNWDVSYAWGVNFEYGGTMYGSKSSSNFVRLVVR